VLIGFGVRTEIHGNKVLRLEGKDMRARNKSKLLFISPFFYPEMISTGKYNTFLVKKLVDYFSSIDVVTSYPFYPDWKPKNSDETIDGVNIIRGGMLVRYPKSQILKRLILELWFLFFVFKYLMRNRKTIDQVLLVFPPVIFSFVVDILLPKNVARIAIVHDLQGVMANTQNSILRKIISKIILKIEKAALRRMGKVISLSKAMENILISEYQVNKLKLEICYPFVTEESADLTETSYLTNLFSKSFLHIVYSGALGEKQKPNELVNVFKAISTKRPDIKCHIISRGPVFESLKNNAVDNNVLFHDLVPDYALDELYRRSTIQVIPQATGVGDGAFPSKLPNLLSKGVPVFGICDPESELFNILENFDFCSAGTTWDVKRLPDDIINYVDIVKEKSHSEQKEEYKDKIDKLFGVSKLINIITSK